MLILIYILNSSCLSDAEACDEITLHVGDVITELEYSEEEDWLCGTAPDGTRGLFPVNFVTSTFHLVPDAWG